MNKKLVLFLVVTVALSLMVNVFAGGWVAAKLANIKVFEKYRILNPQAPIVISKREEPKSNDPVDMEGAVNKAKSRLSSVATIANGNIVVSGSAINLSADGYFLTVVSALTSSKNPTAQPNALPDYIILNNGQKAVVTGAWGEPGTNLAIVKADLSNVPVAEFGSSKTLTAGQHIGFVHSSGLSAGSIFFQDSYVTSSQHNNNGVVFNADMPSRGFGAQASGSLMAGEAVINQDGNFVGIWDGQKLVSGDVANETVRSFFANNQKFIERPKWKFTYRNIGTTESEAFQIPTGALVVEVEATGPAASSGLKSGDSITAVAGQSITEENSLEELLQNRKAGEAVALTVVRDKQLMTITITPTI